jgi:aryl-alcohol dehydrogenase-like predicted oxidoreductase
VQTRPLGKSELELSVIGFGAWAIGGGGWAFGWGPQDDGDSIRAIHRALDLGVTWIDTAPVYGLGHSEEVVARALADRRDKVLVATKCGLCWKPDRRVFPCLKKESVRRECEDSLRRLRVEAIDLYQVHWPNPPRDIEEGWGTVADLVREGKVRHAGVSNFNVAQLKRAQAIHPIASLQPPYSMVNRGVEAEILPFCAEQGIGVIAYSPMQAGLLTDRFSRERLAALDAEDWRRRDRFFQEPALGRTLELVEKLRPIAAREGHTVAQLALAWALRRPELTAAIVGARRPEQVEETAAAGDYTPAPEVLAELARLIEGDVHA